MNPVAIITKLTRIDHALWVISYFYGFQDLDMHHQNRKFQWVKNNRNVGEYLCKLGEVGIHEINI
jgi:hypothetical protein